MRTFKLQHPSEKAWHGGMHWRGDSQLVQPNWPNPSPSERSYVKNTRWPVHLKWPLASTSMCANTHVHLNIREHISSCKKVKLTKLERAPSEECFQPHLLAWFQLLQGQCLALIDLLRISDRALSSLGTATLLTLLPVNTQAGMVFWTKWPHREGPMSWDSGWWLFLVTNLTTS